MTFDTAIRSFHKIHRRTIMPHHTMSYQLVVKRWTVQKISSAENPGKIGRTDGRGDSRYLARVIYKLRLNSWTTKYSQNVTCVCKNILSGEHLAWTEVNWVCCCCCHPVCCCWSGGWLVVGCDRPVSYIGSVLLLLFVIYCYNFVTSVGFFCCCLFIV